MVQRAKVPHIAKVERAPSRLAPGDAEAKAQRVAVLDAHADARDAYRRKNAAYYAEIERLARFYIPPGSRVLEIGSSTGDLLAALQPSRGLGIDISAKLVERARAKHPGLEFRVGDAEELDVDEPFDWIVLSDVVGYVQDVWAVFRNLRKVMGPNSRLLLTYYSFLWKPVMAAGAALGLKMDVPEENWLGPDDLEGLLRLNQFSVVNRGKGTLLPMNVPGAGLANRYLAKLPGLRELAVMNYVVARPIWQHFKEPEKLSVSIVVPTRNERGNVAGIFERLPELGAGTELIIVDGNSDDGTVEEIEKRLASHPRARLIHQGDGRGKGDAVRKGFAAAKGDVLMILDADLTVPPEDLEKFYDAIAEGGGDFVNGTRLVYPMEGEAMRTLNLLGNKFFSVALTRILGTRVKDTLCGTKALRRDAYDRIANGRVYFGDFDPFGDFDLLFGAAKQALEIVEVPVRYRKRRYGTTKIDRFKHGFLLLRMTALAFRKF